MPGEKPTDSGAASREPAVSAAPSTGAGVTLESARPADDPLPWPDGWEPDTVTVLSVDSAVRPEEWDGFEGIASFKADPATDQRRPSLETEALDRNGSWVTRYHYWTTDESPEFGVDPEIAWGSSYAYVVETANGEVTDFEEPPGLPTDKRTRDGGLTDVADGVYVGKDSTTDNWFEDEWRIFAADPAKDKVWTVADWTEVCDTALTPSMMGHETSARIGATEVFFNAWEPDQPLGPCDAESLEEMTRSIFASKIDGSGRPKVVARNAHSFDAVGDTLYFAQDPGSSGEEYTEESGYEIVRRSPDGDEETIATGYLGAEYAVQGVAASEEGVAWYVIQFNDPSAKRKPVLGNANARIYAELANGRRFVVYLRDAGSWVLRMDRDRIAWGGADVVMDEDGEEIPTDMGQYFAELGNERILRFGECGGCQYLAVAGEYVTWSEPASEESGGYLVNHIARIRDGD
ncbi:MAG: hypothetical protein LBT54_06520 [Bifidobacteriaceae bacterium]|nr:hypothetical protein [Bifidobacteriaceae bacterium]